MTTYTHTHTPIECAGWHTYFVDLSNETLIVNPGPDPDAVIAQAESINGPLRILQTHVSVTHLTSTEIVGNRLSLPILAAKNAGLIFDHETPPAGEKFWQGELTGHLLLRTSTAIYCGQLLPCSGPPATPHLLPDTGSLQETVELIGRVMSMPPDTRIYSADTPPATVAEWQEKNNFLALDTKELLQHARAESPPRPLNADAMVAANTGAADTGWAVPFGEEPTPQTPSEVLARRVDTPWSPLILDIREIAETAEGIIPGAVCIPQSQLATSLARILGDKEIIVVSETGKRATPAARFLQRIGFQGVSVLTGGMATWRAEDHTLI